MNKHTWPRTLLIIAGLIASAASARAQSYVIGISNIVAELGSAPPIWVNLAGFTGEAAETLRFDLYVQGFNFTNAESAQFLISGGAANGELQGRVVDRANRNTVLAKAYRGTATRRMVHWFADDFLQAINRVGIAKTQIALKVGNGRASEIHVADFDGHNASAATHDNALVEAPCWVPGRFAIFYSSYMLGTPAIFSQDLASGARKRVAWYGGSNLTPAPSRQGKVAMILSKDGWTDLYVADAEGGNLRRLTRSKDDESSPCWSPDGQWICFATRIDGRRSLCKVPAAGGRVERIKTAGASNPTEPDWSPDGKWIAFTSQSRDFGICVVPSEGGAVSMPLAAGEDPSWAPNSRTLVFARRGTGRLSLLDVPTKQVKDVARVSSGVNSQPSWAR